MVRAQLTGVHIKNNRKFNDRKTAIVCTGNSYQLMTNLQAIIRNEEESTQPIQASKAQIRLETTGEEFPVEREVRESDPVSPKLFSATLEMEFRNLDWDKNELNIKQMT
ncbi:hypothetical protein EVAR_61237_1 [Eumeta japonica]|uniref:Uncharacterized protein n=1 Tax=Eumeta variegata TaxID=151549 RepID=A0A4C1Z909_EUMVA|nr:hypothetical protein EVAR_61237_1 [Eumeta japonica]